MKKVITFGVFDLLHLGHIRLFKRAKSLGDYLIIAVQDEEYITKYKPDAEIVYTTEQRTEMVDSIACVDEVINYHTVDDAIKEVDFDILAVGPEHNHAGFQKVFQYCRDNGKEVVVLDRTKDISSSELKRKIEKIFW